MSADTAVGIALEIPAGLESIKLEGRVQVIAIHLPPGMYLGLKLRAEEARRQSYAREKTIVEAGERYTSDQDRSPSRKGNVLSASSRVR